MQEVDVSHLSEEELAGIIEVFEQDGESAKAYLMIKIEGVRKAWIRRKLASEVIPEHSS